MSEEEEEEGGQGQEGRSGKEEEDKPDNKVGLDFQHSRGPLKCWVICVFADHRYLFWLIGVCVYASPLWAQYIVGLAIV